MIIIKNTGGIGNQMFVFALYKKLISKGFQCKIDVSSFKKTLNHENILISDFFPNIEFEIATNDEIHALADNKNDLLSRIRRKFFKIKKSHIQCHELVYKKFNFLKNTNYYLDGYWQSEKYFLDYRLQVVNLFEFPKLGSERNRNLEKRIKNSNSVSIHVRKGIDYQSKTFINSCNSDYYEKAINLIKEKINNPTFYIFSDNKDWILNNLNLSDCDFEFIDWNPLQGKECYIDMQLMSMCKHNIIANSTYSWWGAWLNKNYSAIKIAPKEWLNNSQYKINDIIPVKWRVI